MKPISRKFLTASALAVSLGLGVAGAQQAIENAPSDISPEVQQQAQEAANQNQPLQAPSQVMPDSFADLVERVAPAVVNITTTAVVSQPAFGQGPNFPEGSPFSDLFRDFGFPGMPDGGPRVPQRSNALGSGFVISSDGFIVTNNHVIEGADEIEIEFYSGEKLPAEVIGTDPKTDIALLKVQRDEPLPFVEFGDSDTARMGDWVLAMGNPLGQGFSASTGIVSARNRELAGTYDDYLQTDAAINRGNSGGPLFDMQGRVIGVNTAILSPNGGSIGIGFSMASNVVAKVVDQLQEFGETRRGWLGVTIQDVTPDMAEALGIDQDGGAMITEVMDGPAKAAGLEAGDVITEFAGGKVEDSGELVRRVADSPAGEPVDVLVLRDGEQMTMQVTLGRRELAEGQGASSVTTGSDQSEGLVLGMTLSPLTPEVAAELGVAADLNGLVVREVDAEGVAAEKGLAVGDVIVEAGQQPLASLSDLEAQVDTAREAGRKSILLLIRRAGEPRFVALPIQDS
ncbi:Do family serine endopeptidase [Paracoccus sp. M683]|uniref:Do family serine endopeptidase n=1 Tax=Paracoccus sp. M683 TaxID=2594268 RepID=UPI002103DAAD|nr:Do family serine endopeptidase [Paracoccus sp. M683]